MTTVSKKLRKKFDELDEEAKKNVKFSTKENPTKSASDPEHSSSLEENKRLKKQVQIERKKYYSGVKGVARLVGTAAKHFTTGAVTDSVKEFLKAKVSKKKRPPLKESNIFKKQ